MRARRTDANQEAVVATFRRHGARVRVISGIGDGVPDLLVAAMHGGKRRWHVVELKDGRKPPSARKLTLDEQGFRDLCPEDYWVCESEQDVLKLITLWENS